MTLTIQRIGGGYVVRCQWQDESGAPVYDDCLFQAGQEDAVVEKVKALLDETA